MNGFKTLTRKSVLAGAIGTVVCTLALAQAPAAQAEIYLRYSDIRGDVTAKPYGRWIQAESVQFGSGRTISMALGSYMDGENTAPTFSEIALTLPTGRSTAPLFLESIIGRMTENLLDGAVTIAFVETTGDGPQEYLEIVLAGALISSFSASNGGDRPNVSVSITYTQIEMTYYPTRAADPTKSDGSQGAKITVRYDLTSAAKM